MFGHESHMHDRLVRFESESSPGVPGIEPDARSPRWAGRSGTAGDRARWSDRRGLESSVDFILNDCFLAFGQAVGSRKRLRAEAVVWLRQHYRNRFLGAMGQFGNRWLLDRSRVITMGFLLGDRAVRYAGPLPEIDADCAKRAAADVERFCTLHAKRRVQRREGPRSSETPLIAGYWCMPLGDGGLPPDRE